MTLMARTVCHIITKLELGGAQQNTLFTVSHLDRTRFRPVLITGEPGLLDAEARALAGVEFHQIPHLVREVRPWADLRAMLALYRRLRQIKPAIVHTHSSKAGILGRLAAWLAGVPIIVHSIHGFGFASYQSPLQRRVLTAVEQVVARLTTAFIAVSEANRRVGIEWGLFVEEQCRVIRSGVDLKAIEQTRIDRGKKALELGLDPDRPIVGMIAALKPQKAPLDFVRVAGRLHRTHPHVQFLLVGDGELRPAVAREIQDLRLGDSFHLVGWRRDVMEIVRCLDVCMLTSLWEGLPRVYVEAVASRVPVVGTNVDGAAEVIRNGVNGFLVEPGDIAALTSRVQVLLDDVALARRMREQGGSLPLEFDIHEMVRRQEREYDRLLGALKTSCPLSAPRQYGTQARR